MENLKIKIQKIADFHEKHGRMPGYKELMSLMDFRSKNSVYKLINKLVGMDILSKDAAGRITFVRARNEIPMLGLVEAGFPAEAEQSILGTLDLNTYLMGNKQSSYLLEVKGDSMVDAGIHEGDLVIAEKLSDGEARVDDIVIAEIDGGWTMKFLKKKSGRIYLAPANKKYKPIYPEYDLKIAAVVRGVIRRY